MSGEAGGAQIARCHRVACSVANRLESASAMPISVIEIIDERLALTPDWNDLVSFEQADWLEGDFTTTTASRSC